MRTGLNCGRPPSNLARSVFQTLCLKQHKQQAYKYKTPSDYQRQLCTMSATAAGRVAGKVGQAASKAASKANEVGNGKGKDSVLQKGAKRDPELYVRHSLL